MPQIPLNDPLFRPDWAELGYIRSSHSNTTLSPKPLPCLLWAGPSLPLTVDTMREQPVARWLSQFPPPCQNTKQKQSKPCFYSLRADSRNHCCITCAVFETFIIFKKKKRKERQTENRSLVWFLLFLFCLERRCPDFSQGIGALWVIVFAQMCQSVRFKWALAPACHFRVE